ncbi:DNA-methyltransferase [Gluconobacter kondonii]|uniref:DNA-methyltransferase n=1 Tax=Gluconobacter kondonii TaxID=941463 RepID=UPI00197D86C7|nr:site-specific DNA-methyltransferase [Gluconobacter kondonii]MBN3866416.1 site-specific DNA-methyltransferase [Gluconobacter kondonii]
MNYFEVYNQDSFAFLKSLDDESVDLIVTSPPYFIGKEYDKSNKIGDFLDIHHDMLPEILRVVKGGGSICWQVGNYIQNGSIIPLDSLIFAAFRCDDLILRNRIVWTFGHGTHANKRFSGRHETIMWYTKGSNYHFDLDAVRVPQKYPGKRHYKGPKKGQWSGNPLGKNPSDVWDIPNVKAGHIEKTDHPCQFPVALVQRLVKALTKKDDLVIDPFCGSGSSGVAALLENRNFLGSDLSENYCEIARTRIQASQNGTVRVRPLDRLVYIPSAKEAVAIRPPHFFGKIEEEGEVND